MSEPQSYWVSLDGETTGPLPAPEIVQQVREGNIAPDVYVCQVGSDEWKRLPEFAEFSELVTPAESETALEVPAPPPPPDQAVSNATSVTNPPWNPVALVWLGFLFWPLWTGVMTAINAKRLGSSEPAWRPLAIGFGSMALSVIVAFSNLGLGTFWEVVLLIVAPLIALWSTDLEGQLPAYEAQRTPSSQDHWIAPVLVGSPLAILMLAGWWAVIFAPLSPREVVERFGEADTIEEAREYVTTNLYRMVDQLKELEKLQPDSDDPEVSYELLDEYYADGDATQCGIDYTMYMPAAEGDPSVTCNGYFHLRLIQDEWKIDDWLITSVNGQSFDGPVSFSFVAAEMLKEAKRDASQRPKAKPNSWLAELIEQFFPFTKKIGGMLALLLVWRLCASKQ